MHQPRWGTAGDSRVLPGQSGIDSTSTGCFRLHSVPHPLRLDLCEGSWVCRAVRMGVLGGKAIPRLRPLRQSTHDRNELDGMWG